MNETDAQAALSRLRAGLGELEAALRHANAPLPDEFPTESLLRLAAGLRELDEAESDASRQVLVHGHDTVRKARRMLRRSVPDGEESPHFALERALNAALAELGDLLEPVPQAQLVALRPPAGSPALVVGRDDAAIVCKLQALEERVAEMEQSARAAVRQ